MAIQKQKWFYELQTKVVKELNNAYGDAICIYQDITDLRVYEMYRVMVNARPIRVLVIMHNSQRPYFEFFTENI